MLQLIQSDTIATAVADSVASTAKAILSGDTTAMSAVASQCLSFCIEAGKCILLAIVIYIVGRFVIKAVNALLSRFMEKRGVDATIQGFLRSLVNVTLTILLLVAVISALGVNTTSFAALIASVGIAFGMALSGNLQNMAGGIVILLFKPFKAGDFIEAQGVSGTVKQIQIFHTLLTTVDNKTIFLPNGALSSGNVVNYNNELRRVDLAFSLALGESDSEIRVALKDLISANPKIMAQSPCEPFVAIASISGTLEYAVRLWVRQEDYWDVFHYMQEGFYKACTQRGIKFPMQHVCLHGDKA